MVRGRQPPPNTGKDGEIDQPSGWIAKFGLEKTESSTPRKRIILSVTTGSPSGYPCRKMEEKKKLRQGKLNVQSGPDKLSLGNQLNRVSGKGT